MPDSLMRKEAAHVEVGGGRGRNGPHSHAICYIVFVLEDCGGLFFQVIDSNLKRLIIINLFNIYIDISYMHLFIFYSKNNWSQIQVSILLRGPF